MPNTREKLIELLRGAINTHTEKKEQWILGGKVGEEPMLFGSFADHLIANGVTIADDVSAVAYNLSPTEQKWIPVTERLPEEKRLVLAVCKSGKIFVGDYWDCYGTIIWRIRTARDSTKNITQIVTHWMPLPEPPKGE